MMLKAIVSAIGVVGLFASAALAQEEHPHHGGAETLGTVHHNLLFGALLVIAIVWLFLRSLRCSLIVASIIPCSSSGSLASTVNRRPHTLASHQRTIRL